MSSKTRCLICVGVGRSDGCHEANPSFHAITKISRILEALTVLVMGINKGVEEAHHHDSILKASQEHIGDQVMQKMVSPWKYSSLFSEGCKHTVQTGTLVVM